MKEYLQVMLQTIKVAPFRLKATLVLFGAVLALSGAVAMAGWTPDRPVLDWNNPAEQIGSTNGPRMNAFINTPYYGDERGFFDSRRTDQTTGTDNYKDILPYVTEGTKEVVLRTYVHNGANDGTNAPNFTGPGVAKNAKVRIDLPTGTDTALRARSYISISNPASGYPAEVTDTTELVDAIPFKIQYVPGSAVIYNKVHPAGYPLGDNIVTTGAPIGYNDMNGDLPGCFDYQAIVEIRVKVLATQPEISKQVRKAGTTAYGETTTVKPGEKVEWLIGFKNNGGVDVDQVAVRDQLPPHLSVIPKSVRWIYRANDGTDKDVVQGDGSIFGSSQLTFGTWKPGGGFYLRFDTTALGDFSECEVNLRNIALVRTLQTPNDITDGANVVIRKDNCNPPITTSSFDCSALSNVQVNRTTFNFTASGTVSNATITGYTFKVNGVTKQDGVNNTYTLVENTPGTYKVTAQVKTNLGTTPEKAVCTQNVEVKPESTEPLASCDALEVAVLANRKVRFTTRVTQDGGAKVTRYFYNFGDGTPELITDKAVVEHTYAKVGDYAAKVKAEFALSPTHNVVRESAKCSANFTIKTTGKLPDTGAGVTEVFATTSALSTLAYYGVAIRRRR